MREKTLGPDHADVAATLASLSFLAVTQANYRLAEQYVERVFAIRTRALGSEHPDTAMTLVTLGRVRHHEARYIDAEHLFQQALGLLEKALGPTLQTKGAGSPQACRPWPSAARAASRKHSLNVGWTWTVAAMSSSRAPISSARAKPADSSDMP